MYAANARKRRPGRGLEGLRDRLLRLPLFYKIVLANAAVVTGVVLATLAAEHVFAPLGETAVFGFIGVYVLVAIIAAVLVNAVIVRLALSPLDRLNDAAATVAAGDLGTRIADSPIADARVRQLQRTFNAMVEGLALTRRRLQEIAARAQAAQEEERKRIARDLHDGLAQTLASIAVRLRVARGTPDLAVRDELLEVLGRELSDAMEEVRGIAEGLRPPALDVLGLVPAIEQQGRRLGQTAGVAVSVRADTVHGLLASEAELALYRIVQEALSNVARHAGAKRVEIRLARSDGHVTVTVADDGRGFRPRDARHGTRNALGLYGMQERAAYLGGRVEVDSAPGRGTRVRITIPVKEDAACLT